MFKALVKNQQKSHTFDTAKEVFCYSGQIADMLQNVMKIENKFVSTLDNNHKTADAIWVPFPMCCGSSQWNVTWNGAKMQIPD